MNKSNFWWGFGIALILVAVALWTAGTAFPVNAQGDSPLPTPTSVVEPTVEPTAEPPAPPEEPLPPIELPEDPREWVEELSIALTILMGLVVSRLTEGLKKARTLPVVGWLLNLIHKSGRIDMTPDEAYARFSGLMADIVSWTFALLAAALIGGLLYVAEFLDASGVWSLLLWVIPSTKGWYEVQKFVRVKW